VNPCGWEFFEEQVFYSLEEIDMPVDVVEVFRTAQVEPDIACRPSRSGQRCPGSRWGDFQRKSGRLPNR